MTLGEANDSIVPIEITSEPVPVASALPCPRCGVPSCDCRWSPPGPTLKVVDADRPVAGISPDGRIVFAESATARPTPILTDDELLALYDHNVQPQEGESDGEAMQREHLAALRRVSVRTRFEMVREIEGIEEQHPGERVIPHLVGVHLGNCHARDRQVAQYVARSIATVLVVEIDQIEGCDGKVDARALRSILARLNVSGGAVGDGAAAQVGDDASDNEAAEQAEREHEERRANADDLLKPAEASP